MAAWGGYPQTVNYSTVNIAKGGGSENLLINPRGKVNQLNEAQGVVAAGQYFCDGWKAGAAGAEIYVDTDGFRLISGSIVQLVPNTIEAGRNLRSNMDVISGAPVMSINGGTSSEPNGVSAYIQLEISGDNSKFSRVILAESVEVPIYQQSPDELEPCKRFLIIGDSDIWFTLKSSNAGQINVDFPEMAAVPALTVGYNSAFEASWTSVTKSAFTLHKYSYFSSGYTANNVAVNSFILDARP
ncbi:hypothetical protein Q9F39_001373 [Vibrio fluvialis]|nr:hypothetical protein [Vibrio fluvialis]